MRCLIIIGLLVGLVGCDESIDGFPDSQPKNVEKSVEKKVEKPADEAIERVGSFADEQKTKLLDSVKASLEDLDTQLETLQEKGSMLTEDAKARWEAKQSQLEAQRLNLLEKLDELRDSSADTWMDLKEGVMFAWIELKKSFDEAARDFKDD